MKKSTLINFCLFALLSANQSCKKDSTLTNQTTSETLSSQSKDDAVITDTSLLCYLPFNSNLKDKSGHNNKGSLVGTVSYVTDRFGNASRAVSFSASNSYIEIPEVQFIGLKTMTISMDFFPTSTNHQELISKMSFDAPIGSPGFYQSITSGIQADGILNFDVRQEGFCNASDGTGWNPPLFANTAVIYNAWNHMAITFNDNIQKLYLNGNLVATDIKTSSPICYGGPIRLAVWWQTDPIYFTGNMDEVRIYNRVLSQKEIRLLSSR
jgi:hypothetical protein